MHKIGPVYRRAFILALLLGAFGLRIYHLDYQSLWRDEVDAIRFSDQSFLRLDSPAGVVDTLTQPGHNGPLYFIGLHGWRQLTGDSEFALRYASLVAGVLMVALTGRAARQLGLGRGVAFIAALLVAGSPYLIWYSQEAKMYTWLTCLVLMSLIAFQRALISNRGRWWVAFVVITSLSYYVHILAPLMMPVYGMWGGIQWWQGRRYWRGWGISLALLVFPYLPLAWWQKDLFLDSFQSGHPFYPLGEQLALLLHLYSVGILRTEYRYWSMALVVLLAVIALFYLFNAFERGLQVSVARQSRLLLLGWLFIPVILVYLISLRVTVFEDRYVIYILPAFYLLLALGCYALASRVWWLGGLALLAILVFNSRGIWLQAHQVIKADFRAAAQYIEAGILEPTPVAPAGPASIESSGPFKQYLPLLMTDEPDTEPVILVQMPYLHHTLAYYFRAPYHPLDGIWTNDFRNPALVSQEMTELTAGLTSLWFVVAEEDHWDNRHLVRGWLETNGALLDEAQFVGVAVYHYGLPAEPP